MDRDFIPNCDLESLYEQVYQEETEALRRDIAESNPFPGDKGSYHIAKALDFSLWCVTPFFLAGFLLAHFPAVESFLLLGVLGPIALLAIAATVSSARERKGQFQGVGPFGWLAHRLFLKRTSVSAKRFDPWSSEAIQRVVFYTRRRIQREQLASLGRVWDAKKRAEAAISTATGIREQLAMGTTSELLQSARLDAVDRLLRRHQAVMKDLAEQERIANEAPAEVLAFLDLLDVELGQRHALQRLIDEEENAVLLEAEAAGIRESMANLTSLVRHCESALSGLSFEVQSREAAEEELRRALRS